MEILEIIIKMVWIMLPAYLANPAAAIIVKLTGTGIPIDFYKSIGDTRILGNGKTFKGFFFGVSFGIFVAIIQNLINIRFLNSYFVTFNLIAIFTLPFGSLLGDLIASFFKRRTGFKRGQAFPLLDQLDFVIGAGLLTYIFNSKWFVKNFTVEILITVLILTPILHLLFNVIGYKLKISKEPW